MSKLTALDVVKLIKKAVSYGDDPLEEACAQLSYKYLQCTDEEEKKVYKELIELLDILYDRMFR